MAVDVRYVLTSLLAIPVMVFYPHEKRSANPHQMRHHWQPGPGQQTDCEDFHVPEPVRH